MTQTTLAGAPANYTILHTTELFKNARRWAKKHKATSRYNDILWFGGSKGWAVIVHHPKGYDDETTHTDSKSLIP